MAQTTNPQPAADEFFAELDPPDEVEDTEDTENTESREIQAQAPAEEQAEQKIGERASKLVAISMDMGPGYAKSARAHAPQAVICIDNFVRHEALPVRVGCETPPPGCRGSPVKLRAA